MKCKVNKSLAVAIVGLALAGCISPPERIAVPKALVEQAHIKEYKDIRFWGDEAPSARMVEAFVAQIRAKVERNRKQGKTTHLSILSLSGGGSDGAFGAGFLVGWSEARTRPSFDVVTGVSTGSLIAPFAFLGTAYDQQLKTVFTTITTRDILEKDILRGLLGGSAIANSRPLFRLISKYFDRSIMAAVAREHRNGRRLYVGTTNNDAQRPVIWDIGAIAESGQPDALNLIRKILLASSSVPGAFPPVRLIVHAYGKQYDELHVDGGVTGQVFLYPGEFKLAALTRQLGGGVTQTAFIIRNGKITPEWKKSKAELFSAAGRAISTLIKYQANGDLIKLYGITRRDGIKYRLVYIPASFDVPATELFDKKQMNALYNLGYRLSRNGYRWATTPPGLPVRSR